MVQQKRIPSIAEYNEFCSKLSEGSILYNLDSTNHWGEYLLVANIATIKTDDYETYTMMLLGLKKEDDRLVPRDLRIKMTPDYAGNVPFLKYVGCCNYRLIPEINEVYLNTGLVTVYGTTDLRKYNKGLVIRKSKKRKYGKDGRLIIKNTENEL